MLARVLGWRFAKVPPLWTAVSVLLYILLAAIIAIYALTLWAPSREQQAFKPIDAERDALLFAALHDLQESAGHVARLKKSFTRNPDLSSANATSLPVGSIRHETTLLFSSRYFDDLAASAYGEQAHIFHMVLALRDIATQLNALKRRDELQSWLAASKYAVDDVGFLIGFLHFYLYWFAEQTISPDRLSSLQGRLDTHEYQSELPIAMMYFREDDQPITSYGYWLGLID